MQKFYNLGLEKFETGLSQTKPVILPSPRLSEFYKTKIKTKYIVKTSKN